MTNRIIFNSRGEAADAYLDTDSGRRPVACLTLRLRADRITECPDGMSVCTYESSVIESLALALKIADANGYICELRPGPSQRPRRTVPARGIVPEVVESATSPAAPELAPPPAAKLA